MPNIDSVAATETLEPQISDAAALDAICALLNTTVSGADVYQEVALILCAAGRPFVDNAPVLETRTGQTAHGLATADVLVDGEPAIHVWVSHDGTVHAIALDHDRPLSVEIPEGADAGRAR